MTLSTQAAGLPNGQGYVLQTIFTGNVTVNANRSFVEMDAIRQARISNSQAREAKFMLETALGYAAMQARSPGSTNRAFPQAQGVELSEKTAAFKEFNVTLEVPQQVVDSEKSSPEKYESLLALETAAKATIVARLRCCDYYLDGTGVHGTAASAANVGTLATTGQVDVTMAITDGSRGHAGCFEIGDLYVPKQVDGTARTCSGSPSATVYALKVLTRNHRTQVVRFQICDSSETAITGVTATNIASTDVFYRVGQPSANGYSGSGPNLSSISDYDTVSENVLGLHTLGAWDGRVAMGITFSGATGGTHYDHSGALVGADVLEQLISDGEIAVGNGTFKWPMALMHPLTRSQILKEREADRRFTVADDAKRGVKFMSFQHEDQTVRIVGREFAHPTRMHLTPAPSGSDRQKPIALIGSDFKPVVPPGGQSEWFLKSTSSGYVAAFQSFLWSRQLFMCTYPASILTAHGYVNS